MIAKIASAIYNDVVSGLAGLTSTPALSKDQLEDDVVDEWLQIIKEYAAKNIIPRRDLLLAVNCIPVDEKSLNRCPIISEGEIPLLHFEIPQVVNDFIEDTIEFIGTSNRDQEFKVYLDKSYKFHKYLRRGANKPYVYIETTPNENNMYDGWVFNLETLDQISIVGIFKDMRQLENYSCCDTEELENKSFIIAEIKKRLTEKKLRYYKMLATQPQPNTQAPR